MDEDLVFRKTHLHYISVHVYHERSELIHFILREPYQQDSLRVKCPLEVT